VPKLRQMRCSQFSALFCVFAALFMSAVGAAAADCAPPCSRKAFPAQFGDAEIFETAVATAERLPIQSKALSGVTVPHHLLAADLIARTLRMVNREAVRKIVILFPDHFKRTRLPFATTRRDFQTVFGLVRTDDEDADKLLAVPELVEESTLFAHDHGIGAILPFVSHYFPGVPIIPVAVSIRSHRADWDKLAAELTPIIDPSTLIIQSTDFSHYLPLNEATQRDQESLNVISAGDLDAAAGLLQPQNTDSRGAQYIQLKLQQTFFHADPVVLFNKNSQTYSDEIEPRTTSYIIEVYAPKAPDQVGTDDDGSKVFCFAGDSFFGRDVARQLANADAARRVQDAIRAVLNNCRLIVNLEGVMVPTLPRRVAPTTLAMPEKLTLEWLRALNVVGVSLANNHAMDLGGAAYARMVRTLRAAGIAVVQRGEIVDLGRIRVAALTDLDNATGQFLGVITKVEIEKLSHLGAGAPAVAFVHWGHEGAASPDERQRALAHDLAIARIPLIAGAHPHVASRHLDLVDGPSTLRAFSLGNFIFDQSARRASGGVLEVRVFDQGTFAARLVPIANYFDLARPQAAKN
jgi:AmmeMemoRadiSam system protein B